MLEPASPDLRRRLTEVAEPVLSALAVEATPGFVAALSLRQSRDTALKLLSRGDLDAAGELIAQIETTCEQQHVSPAFLKTVHLAAIDLLEAGSQTAEAAGLLDGLCARFPEEADYAVRLARLAVSLGDRPSARAAFSRLLDRVPASAEAHRGLASLDEAAGDATAALEHWRAVQRALPRDPGAATAVVRLLAKAGQPTEAQRAMQLAIAADPGLAPTLASDAGVARR